MFVELHLLQNFAPSNLNRDDTGAPKDCEFGGYRRARISSQCLKRAMRSEFKEGALLPPEALAVRTKNVIQALTHRLAVRGKSADEARGAVEGMLREVKLVAKDDQTQYLLFLGEREIEALVGVCIEYWDVLPKGVSTDGLPAGDDPVGGGRRAPKDSKKSATVTLPPAVKKAVLNVLDGGRAADLALFGRMIADQPGKNVDAACQVAHAISTHKVSVEFDFYTAVDDLPIDDATGAGMMGTIEFNSACYYRYANVNVAELASNLGGDADLARQALAAFIWATISAVPSGKQNSMAAQNPPSLVLAVARERGLWSLANAFCKPVSPGRDGDLMARSVVALDSYWASLVAMYGVKGIVGTWVCALDPNNLTSLASAATGGINALVDNVVGGVSFGPAKGTGAR